MKKNVITSLTARKRRINRVKELHRALQTNMIEMDTYNWIDDNNVAAGIYARFTSNMKGNPRFVIQCDWEDITAAAENLSLISDYWAAEPIVQLPGDLCPTSGLHWFESLSGVDMNDVLITVFSWQTFEAVKTIRLIQSFGQPLNEDYFSSLHTVAKWILWKTYRPRGIRPDYIRIAEPFIGEQTKPNADIFRHKRTLQFFRWLRHPMQNEKHAAAGFEEFGKFFE